MNLPCFSFFSVIQLLLQRWMLYYKWPKFDIMRSPIKLEHQSAVNSWFQTDFSTSGSVKCQRSVLLNKAILQALFIGPVIVCIYT